MENSKSCYHEKNKRVLIEIQLRDFPGIPVVKNPPSKAGGVGSIPGLGRSPGEGEILWTEEPGRLQPVVRELRSYMPGGQLSLRSATEPTSCS